MCASFSMQGLFLNRLELNASLHNSDQKSPLLWKRGFLIMASIRVSQVDMLFTTFIKVKCLIMPTALTISSPKRMRHVPALSM